MHFPNRLNAAYQFLTSLFHKRNTEHLFTSPINQQYHPLAVPDARFSSDTHVGTDYSPSLPFDLSLLEDMDDNEYIVEIISMFLKDTPYEINDMQDAVMNNNLDALCAKAHKIKSSAGLLQASKFLDVLIKIEDKAQAGHSGKEMIALVERAQREYNVLAIALQRHRQQLMY